LALVRNHELTSERDGGGANGLAYDTSPEGRILPGGTTTLVLDAATLKVERQYRSLSGTIRNCSGGVTPWGSWLSCEEDVTQAGSSATREHGWIFEVPADASGPVNPVPLKAMGRFKHEAAAVDPVSGHVYLTEDRDDGLLYRFIPKVPGKLTEGGKLQALALTEPGLADSRNWTNSGFRLQRWYGLRWIDLDDPESPADDLRKRGAAAGALLFARGEGIHLGLSARGTSELFFVCTSGGAARFGQVFRLELSPGNERLQLFFESDDESQFNFGDNITVAPDGQLVVCEDQYTATVDNHLRGLTRDGQPYPLARLRTQTELAGACFSPDGKVLFVNAYSPAKTLAISGPWSHLRR
jgi:secreted PhoX family phosphatase